MFASFHLLMGHIISSAVAVRKHSQTIDADHFLVQKQRSTDFTRFHYDSMRPV